MVWFGGRAGRQQMQLRVEFFKFLIFFNNILILTRFRLYLHVIARLVTPAVMARQLASVAPRWWDDPALRHVGANVSDPVPSHALARQCLFVAPSRVARKFVLPRQPLWAAFLAWWRNCTALSRHPVRADLCSSLPK